MTVLETLAAPVRHGFRGLAAVRSARAFHPVGESFAAELKIFPGEAPPGPGLFEHPGPHRALVRLSRGVGLPEPLPDVLGLALKIPDAYGPGQDQDLLFASCWPTRLGRYALAPSIHWVGHEFSTILPYRIGGRMLMLGMLPERTVAVDGSGTEEVEHVVEQASVQYRFAVAEPFGPWRTFGALYVEEPYDGDITFDPYNTDGELCPAGPLNLLRLPAYDGSRAGRR